MKMAYEFNDLKGFLFLVLIAIPKTLSTNIDCGGKPFHCLNSTHFMICVDLGGGVSSTIDDFIIPCPPTTVCQKDNRYECEFPKIKEPSTPLFIVGISTIPPDKATTVLSATEKNIAPVTTAIDDGGETKSSNNNEIVDNLKEEFTAGNKMLSEENVAPLMNTGTESQSMIEVGLVSPKIEEIFATTTTTTTTNSLHTKLETDTLNDKAAEAFQQIEGHTTPLYANSFYKEKDNSVPPQPLNGIITIPQDKMDTVQSVIGTNIVTTLPAVHTTTRNGNTEILKSLTEEFHVENKKLVKDPLKNSVTLSPNIKEMHLISPKIEEMVTITNKYADTKSKAETFTESVMEDFPKNENSTTFNVFPQIDVSISTIPPNETTVMQSSTEKYIITVKPTTQETMSTLNNGILESLKEEFTGGNENIFNGNISPLMNTVNSSHTVNETKIASPKIDETGTTTNEYVYTTLKTDSFTNNLMEVSPKIKDTTTLVYDYSYSVLKEETIPTPIEVSISTIPSDETTTVLSSSEKYITTVKPTMQETTSTLNNAILDSLKEEFTGGNEKIFEENISPLMNTVNSSHTVNKADIASPKIHETVTITDEYGHTKLKTDSLKNNIREVSPKIEDTTTSVYDYSFSSLKEKAIPTPTDVSISTTPSAEATTVLSSTEKYITTVKPTMQETTSTLNNDISESLKEELTGGNEKIFKENVSSLMNTVNSSHTVNETKIASPKIDETVTTTNEYVYTELKTDSVTNNLMGVSPKIKDTTIPVYDYSFSGSKEETIPPPIEVSISTIPTDETTTVLSSSEKYITTVKPTMQETTSTLNNAILDSLKEEFTGGNEKIFEENISPLMNTVNSSHTVNKADIASPKIHETVTITDEYGHTKLKTDSLKNNIREVSPKIEDTTTSVYDYSFSSLKEKAIPTPTDVSISTTPSAEATTVLSSTEKYITTVKPTMQETTSTLNNDISESLKEELTGGNEKIFKENVSSLMNTVNSSHTVNETKIASPKIDETVTTTNEYVYTELKTDSVTNNLMGVSPKIKDTTIPVYDYSFSGSKEETIPPPIEVSISTIPTDETTTVLSSSEKYITTVKPTMQETTSTLNNEILDSLKKEFTGGNEKIFEENISPLMNRVNSSHTVNKAGIASPKIHETVTITNEYVHTKLKTDSLKNNIREVSPKIENTTTSVYDYSFSSLKEKAIPTPTDVSISTTPSPEATTVLSSTEKYITTVKPTMQETTSTLNNDISESLKEEFTGGNEKIFKENVSSLMNTVNSSHIVNKTGVASPKGDETVTITHEYVYTELKTESVTNNLMGVSPKIKDTTIPVYDYSFSGSKEETIPPLMDVSISTIPSDETTTVLSSMKKYIATVGPTMEKTKSSVNNDEYVSFKEEFMGGTQKIFEGNIISSMNTVRPSYSIIGTDLTSPIIDKTVTTTNKYVQTKLNTEITGNKLMEVSPQNIGTTTPFSGYSFSEPKEETIPPLKKVSIKAMLLDKTKIVLSSTEKYTATMKPVIEKTTSNVNNEVLHILKEELTGGNEKVFDEYIKSTNIVEPNHGLSETSLASPETVTITYEYPHTTLKTDTSTNKLMKVSSEIDDTTTRLYEFSDSNPKENSMKRQIEFGISTVPPDEKITILPSTKKNTTTMKSNIEKTTSSVSNDVHGIFKDEITGRYDKNFEEPITSSMNTVTPSPGIIETAFASPTIGTIVTNTNNYFQTKPKTEISTNKLMEVSPKIRDTTTPIHDFSFSNPREKNIPPQIEMSKLTTPLDDMITVLASTEKYIATDQPTLEKATSNLNSEVLESLKEEFTGGSEIFFEGNIIPLKNTVRPSNSIIETGIVSPKIDKMSISSDEYLHDSLEAENSTNKLMEVSPKIEDTTSPVYDFKFSNSKGKSISPQIEVGTPTIQPDEITTILSSNEKYITTMKPTMEKLTFNLNNGVSESLKKKLTVGNEKVFGGHVTSLPNTVLSSSIETDLTSPKKDESVATTDKLFHTKLKTESSINKLLEEPLNIEHTATPILDLSFSNSIETRVSLQILVGTPTIQQEGTTIKPIMEKSIFNLNNDVSQGLMEKNMRLNENVFEGHIVPSMNSGLNHSIIEINLASPKKVESVTPADKSLQNEHKLEISTYKLMEVTPKVENIITTLSDRISNSEEKSDGPQIGFGLSTIPNLETTTMLSSTEKSNTTWQPTMEKTTSKVNNDVLESFKEEFTGVNEKVFEGNIPSTNIVRPSHDLRGIDLASPKIDETVTTSNEYLYTNLKTETSTNKLVEVSSKMEDITTRFDGLSFSNPKERNIPPQTDVGISTISPDKTAALLLSDSSAAVLQLADKYITMVKPTMENPTSNLSNDVSESLQEEFTGGNEKFFEEYVTPFTNTIDTIHGLTETAFSSTKIDETVTTTKEDLFTELKTETSTNKLMKVLTNIVDTTTLVYDLSFSNPKEKNVSPQMVVATLTTSLGETIATLSPTEKITSNFNTDVSDFASPEIDETVITTNEHLHSMLKTETSIHKKMKVSPKIADTTASLYDLSFFDPKGVQSQKGVGLPTIPPDKTTAILSSTEKKFAMGKPTMEITKPNLANNVAERLKDEFTLNSHITPPQIKVGMSMIPSDKPATILLATEKYIPTVQPSLENITYNLNENISKSLKEELTGGNGNIFKENIAPTTNTVTSSYSIMKTGFASPKIDEPVTTIEEHLLIKLKPETSTNKIMEDFPKVKDTITPLYDFSPSNSKELSFSPDIEVAKSTIPSVETTTILFSTSKYIPTVKSTMKKPMSNMNNDALETLKEITGGYKKNFEGKISSLMNTVSSSHSIVETGLVSPKINETVNSDESLYSKTKNSTNQAEVSLKIDNFATSSLDFGVSNVKGKSNAPQMTVGISTTAAGEATTKLLTTEKYLPTVKPTLEETTSIFNSDVLENSKEAVMEGRDGIVSSGQSIMETNLVSPKRNENIFTTENPQTKIKSEISTVSVTPTTIFEDTVTSADGLITVATQTQTPQLSLIRNFNLDKNDISLKNQLPSANFKSQQKTYSISPVQETVSEIPIGELNSPEIPIATSTQNSNRDNLEYANEAETRLNNPLNVNLNTTSKLHKTILIVTPVSQTINISSTPPSQWNNKSKRAFDTRPLPTTNRNVEEKTSNTVDCLKMPRGKYADSKDCRKFYICIGKCKPIVGICPNNTVFSEINKQCTRNLSHCVRNNQFHCLYEGRFSDYLKGNIYYICVKNNFGGFLRYKLQCQNGYHLNKMTTKCENDLEMDKQSASSVISNSSNDRNESMVKSDFSENSENSDFECKKEGRFPYSKDCRKYYVCTKNSKNKYRRKIKTCSSDEAFDRKKKKCVSAESNECYYNQNIES